MYRAKLHTRFVLADFDVEPAVRIVEDVHAASVLILRAGDVEKYEPRPNPPLDQVKTALIVRPGGLGDLLFASPIIAALHKRGVKVTVSSHRRFHCVLEELPCTIADYPLTEEETDAFDARYFFENLVENSKDKTHIIDLFNSVIGVELESYQCIYTVTEQERAWAKERFPNKGKPRIAIQSRSSADSRNYPDQLMARVGSGLIHAGFDVFLFGQPGSIRIDGSSPYMNLTAHGLDVRQSCAVLEQCDACVAPDSFLAHASGAMGVGCVALFASFPWEARTKYAPSIHALSGHAPCAPCFHHARTDPWVQGMPCATAKVCVALAQISPERIVAQVEKMILK